MAEVRQDRLDEYRAKRDFDATPEPAGDRRGDDGSRQRFVVQQHDATRLHWDLRLESDGVLWSWALPKCLPWDPKRNHLAVRTEDHPLEYLTFEGDIPEGSYGAGHMFVWDHGTYELVSEKEGKVVIELRGDRVSGRYALFRTGGERDWMIHRMDPPPDPTRAWPPAHVPPMRAVPGEVVDGDDWAWEIALRGVRVQLVAVPGDVQIVGADGDDLTSRFPEVRRIGRALGSTEVILDGVVVGEPYAIEQRQAASASSVRRLSTTSPLQVALFDLVWFEGHPVWDEPWDARRARLDALALDGPAWTTPRAHIGDGPALADAAGKRGAEALVGKRRESRYDVETEKGSWRMVAL
jgi:bifunctional non-homologous end joining protein LigD